MIFPGLSILAQPLSRECAASFIYTQDPTDHLIINFTSTSSGEITDYFWEFGDGSTFHGENPSHAYPYTGEFTVCLIISNTDTLNPCADTICRPINVELLSQYNIGGLLFAGDFPINNPISTGDTAYAYLYRFDQTLFVPVDTTTFDTLGYFWFAGVTEGKYFLKTGLLPNSLRFGQYLPAYYGDHLLWTDADTLDIDKDMYNLEVYLVPGNPLSSGGGRISGRLVLDQATGEPRPVDGGQVILADAEGDPYYCTYSDVSGEFLFDDIPYGEYRVFGEYTGRLSQLAAVFLDVNNPNADSLEVKLYMPIPGIEDPMQPGPDGIAVFPNPAETFLKVRLSLDHPEHILVHICNSMGRVIKSEDWSLPAGDFCRELFVADLAPAVYLVSFREVDSDWLVLKKFIKK